MTAFAALLRAINVGGTGKLAMSRLTELCEHAGFTDVATYIQSGNVVFNTQLTAAKARATLEHALARELGKPAAVVLRTADELSNALRDNPFKQAPPNFAYVLFLNEAPAESELTPMKTPGGEQLVLIERDLYLYYPDGMGRSKLKLPAFANHGTSRNLNTVAKLAEMTRAL